MEYSRNEIGKGRETLIQTNIFLGNPSLLYHFVSISIVKDAEKGTAEVPGAGFFVKENAFYLRVNVTAESKTQFAFSTDGKNFRNVGEPFTARKGKWIGARVGIFAVRTGKTRETGYADFDWFRIE